MLKSCLLVLMPSREKIEHALIVMTTAEFQVALIHALHISLQCSVHISRGKPMFQLLIELNVRNNSVLIKFPNFHP